VTKLLLDYGLVLLFLVVFVESAGAPFVPGETALVAAAVMAHKHFSLTWVIVVAGTAAIAGFTAAYWLGRLGGRRLLARWDLTSRYANRVLPRSERFFERHGPKTVFFGRFVAFLRATVGWMAGITHMSWWRFLAWNVAGGVVWAVAIGLLAYWAGKAVADAITSYGAYAVVAVIVVGLLGFAGVRVLERRAARS
jgi:membrane protein DedA with SNARE-associated domain